MRIDHIGSTAVPGLPAKDILDVQITVADLADRTLDELDRAGFRRLSIVDDHRPPGTDVPDHELEKRLFNAPLHERPANIHVRVEGRFNQRYPLLCRDYLRTHPAAARAYADVKTALARIVGGDIEAYYDVKDPVFDIIMAGANEWAAGTRWTPAPSDA
jgi:GrpB-like predicted nucleotidyltransferase (UPF0157 family)